MIDRTTELGMWKKKAIHFTEMKKLSSMALIDPLTGLFNRRYLGYLKDNPSGVGQLQREFDEAVRGKQDLSSLMIDIDDFKEYNDTYGHPEGDLALKAVADTIKKTIRDIDIPFRYGGEEIFILLPQTAVDGAKILAERLRENIATSLERPITVSIGAASYHNSKENRDRAFETKVEKKDDLVEKADIAMYFSKQTGKNRVTIANDMTQIDVLKMKEHREKLHPYLKQQLPAGAK